MNAASRQEPPWPLARLAGALLVWCMLYASLAPFADGLLAHLPLPAGPLREGVRFFVFEAPKVLMLLILIVFLMGIVRTLFSPQRTRALLAGRREGVGNVLAACLGIVTPFCSCSAVPMFVGFVSAGVPLGVTFSFLIAAPMINEIALGLLFALFGWQVALTYLTLGLGVGILAGWVLGRLHLEGWLEPWVRDLRTNPAVVSASSQGVAERIAAGRVAVKDIVGRTWGYILLGIAIGAFLHGYVPADLLGQIMGPGAWWSVPLSVLIGIPMYANAAAIVPVAMALLEKGAALGTVLAFMMSVTALSLPEMIILRKVLSLKLIGVFIGVVGTGILIVGYLFNLFF